RLGASAQDRHHCAIHAGRYRRERGGAEYPWWLVNTVATAPNDPSSATAATRRVDYTRSAMPPFAAAHDQAASCCQLSHPSRTIQRTKAESSIQRLCATLTCINLQIYRHNTGLTRTLQDRGHQCRADAPGPKRGRDIKLLKPRDEAAMLCA